MAGTYVYPGWVDAEDATLFRTLKGARLTVSQMLKEKQSWRKLEGPFVIERAELKPEDWKAVQ
jgi:hypothetical protein